MGFFSQVFLVFLIKESKKRRRKQPDKLTVKSRPQLVNLPGARPLMSPLLNGTKMLPKERRMQGASMQNTVVRKQNSESSDYSTQ